MWKEIITAIVILVVAGFIGLIATGVYIILCLIKEDSKVSLTPSGVRVYALTGKYSKRKLKQIRKGTSNDEVMGYHKDHHNYIAWDNTGEKLVTADFVYPDDCLRWLERK